MNPPSSQPTGQLWGATPGKIRTWWHPLLANLLRWQLGSHYHLEEEVPVGQKPLQIDILLLHKEQGELPASARRLLAGLVEYLGEYTLLEFKSPSDTLRAGDFQTFLAYALLYRAQNHSLLEPARLHQLVLAPRLTRPYRDELQTLGVTVEPQERGIWRLQGGLIVHRTWVLETEELAGLEHPLLTLVSPRFLNDRVATYDSLHQGGYTELVVYLAQQIRQFSLRGKEFAMPHLGSEDQMRQTLRDFLATLPAEELLEGLSRQAGRQALRDFLATLSPEELLRGLSPEKKRQAARDLLASLPPEERLQGLSPEELERLRQLLQVQPRPENGALPE
jgi:hypothetical protein